jgi:hypothetical protein
MLYRKIIAVCSEIHTKHINTLCEQKVEFNVKLVVHIVTSGLQKVKEPYKLSPPGKTKLDISSLTTVHFTKLQRSQNKLTANISVNLTNTRCFITATFATLIHSELSQRYLAARRCNRSG